jgi:fimbrial isopeptide formation D2 family protein/LPXTG-motif cell wall-anchored protein
MKKSNGLKRLMAFLTAMVMVLGCVMVNVYAESSGWYANNNNNILQVKSYLEGRSYKAYQIFTGDESKGTLSNIKWGVSVKDGDKLIAALQSDTLADGRENTAKSVFANTETSTVTSATDVANRLLSVTDNDVDLKDTIAYIIRTELYDQKGETLTSGEAIKINGVDGTAGYHYSFGSLHDGYYLVEETTDVSGTDSETASKYMVNVNGPTTVVTKAEAGPTIDKEIVTNGTRGTGETLGKYDDVAIDDTVTFKLSSKVPNMKGYNKYFFIMEDTLSKGLTYTKDDANFEITVGTKTLTEGTDYYVKDPVTDSTTGKTTIKIVFKNFINYTEGQEISVYYNAKLNDQAVIGNSNENNNSARINYSNNPNVTYKGVTPEGTPGGPEGGDPDNGDEPGENESIGNSEWSVVYVYTTAVKLIKVNAKSERLTGAVFTVKGTGINTIVKVNKTYTPVAYYTTSDTTEIEALLAEHSDYYLKKSDGNFERSSANLYEEAAKYDAEGNQTVNGTLYKNITKSDDVKYETETSDDQTYAKAVIVYQMVENVSKEEQAETKTWTGTVGDDGELLIEGIPAGEYKITEITAPAGYNLLENAISIKVAYTVTDTATYKPVWDVTVDTKGGTDYVQDTQKTPSDGIHVMRIINKEGTTLPSTGGMGTKLFYLFGSILLIGASILLITKRRMSNNLD